MVSDKGGKALEYVAEGGVCHPSTQEVLPGREGGEASYGSMMTDNKANYEAERIQDGLDRYVASETMQRVRVAGNTELATPFETAQRDLASLKVKIDVKEEGEGSDTGDEMVSRGKGDDGLTDEELAWRLHKELNSGSPVFRTRSQRGTNGRERSNLAESALGVKAALDKQKSGEGIEGQERRGKRRGGQARLNKSIGTSEKSRGIRKGKRATGKSSAVEENGEDSKQGKASEGLGPLVTKNSSPKSRVNERASGSADNNSVQKSSEEEVSEQKENNNVSRRSRKGKNPQAAFAEGSAATATDATSQQQDSKGKNGQGIKKRKVKGPPKIPKLPMVQHGDNWFRTRVLEETEAEILVEFAGFEHQMPSEWIPKYCKRVWLGSYKGSDWKYQGQGAWVPKKGCVNRHINLADFGHEDPSDQSLAEKKPEENQKNKTKRSNSIMMVNTPSLQEDMSTTLDAEKRSQKRKIGSKAGADENHFSGRKSQRKSHRSSPGEAERLAEGSTEDSDEAQKKIRPRRATKSAAIYKDTEFAVEADIESSDHDHLDTWADISHEDNKANEKSARPKDSRHNRRKPVMKSEIDLDLAPSLEEQEALAALAEMPSSPLTISVRAEQNDRTGISNGKLHSLKNEASDVFKKRPGRRPKSDQKRKFEIGQGLTSNSLVIAEQMFGGLLGAVSSRMSVASANRRKCQPSFLPQRSQCSRLLSWSPHIWSSGVYPANGQPAILTVPKSLIRQALGGRHFQETDYARERIVKPPVPLFC